MPTPYSSVIEIAMAISDGGGTTNPSDAENGEYGSQTVIAAIDATANRNSLPGRLRKNGRCVRITIRIIRPVNVDSTNQPVWNSMAKASVDSVVRSLPKK